MDNHNTPNPNTYKNDRNINDRNDSNDSNNSSDDSGNLLNPYYSDHVYDDFNVGPTVSC